MNKLLFVIFLSLSLQVNAAITLVAHTSAIGNTTTSAINTSSCTGCLIIAYVLSYQAAAGTFSDSQSNTWTVGTTCTATDVNTSSRIRRVYAKNASVSATHTFTVASGNSTAFFVMAFSGADPTAPSNGDQSCVGDTNPCNISCSSSTITPPQSGALVVSGDSAANNTVFSIAAPFTKEDAIAGNLFTNVGGTDAMVIQTTAIAATAVWTDNANSSNHAILIESFKPAASGPPAGQFPIVQ